MELDVRSKALRQQLEEHHRKIWSELLFDTHLHCIDEMTKRVVKNMRGWRDGERDIYIYIWQLGHLLPTFCSKMPLFPQFYSKNGSKNCPYMDKFFAFFWILSKCTFNQFLEDIRM